MTVDEIKQTHSMTDIVEAYGFHPNRIGFIPCPFHKGDHQASMKIYKDSYNCFGCGANGDIFKFIQNMDNCDFKTAFYGLGGTYEKPTTASKLALYRLKKAKETRSLREVILKAKMRLNNMKIGIYVTYMKRSEPLSDVWCDCMNEYTKCLGYDEYLKNEMEGGNGIESTSRL